MGDLGVGDWQDDRETQIVEFIRTHPTTLGLLESPNFTEMQSSLDITETLREKSLITGALASPQKMVMAPFFFKNRREKSIVMFAYLGDRVCGHPGIVHGGLLATLLDEGLARCCFPELPNKVGVTANLNIDYRAPAVADTYIVLKARTTAIQGRKAWVEGSIETLPVAEEKPTVLVEATALFIEPKSAAAMESPYKET
ncbi:uncharacterized protein N7459_008372 [Penicillium hispanicum]|uniref:uncharacterized protein n=1 Tax=Penicillium hispanicum TaxID=1080232 RepID=UPI00253F6857|nr:uncharacterized protein N7459_008372 [Penicillium hispanicum]KAJ5573945.1 hypothetical protein N7459_008372 [Penicillium hispanicum]